jgi:hypothetical protein
MSLRDLKTAWTALLIAEGATEDQAEAEWAYQSAKAEWDAYQQAQEAYELMAEQGEVPH